MSDLTKKLKQQLSPDGWHWLRQIGTIAADLNLPLYLVGGIVRDILLGRSSPDLDLVIEGSAISLAKAVHEQHGGELTTHEQFDTANWRPSKESPIDIDFVTARTETYRQPAALPVITPAPINADLLRRDFTINALAIRLDGDHLGTLLDRHQSQADLKAKRLRILHPKSFIDDPTRIWRGIRFEQRLGFTFEPKTLTLLQDARPHLKELSADRIRHELDLILQETDPIPAIKRLDELQILTAASPHLKWNPVIISSEKKHNTPLGQLALDQLPRPQLRLITWLAHLPAYTIKQIAERLNFPRQFATQCQQAASLHQTLRQQPQPWSAQTSPSTIANQIPHLREAPAVAFAATASHATPLITYQLISRYYTDWRHVTPHTTGHTLRQQNIPPGPIYSQVLTILTNAWIDGLINSEAEEQAYLQAFLDRRL